LGQAVLMLAALDVLLAAEATAGIQVKAIAQDRMKVMRRMGDLALVQFNRDMRNLNLMGSSMPDCGFARCDGHHETVDFRLRKIGARQKINNQKD
jgi:hypothetical protein